MSRVRLAWALLGSVIVAACTSTAGLATGEDDLGDAGAKPKDGGTTKNDGGGVTDAPTPIEVRCDPSKPFGAPSLVTGFDATADYVKSAVLTPDELEVYYLRYQGSGNWDLRHARRAKPEDAWPSPETIPLTPSPDGFLSLTAGGLKLYFWTLESNYRSTRPSVGSVFGTPAKYDVASAPWAFFVDADDTAYFAKIEEGGAERTIRKASANTSGFSSTSQVVPNIHVAGASDNYPVLNRSETVIYFASNRAGGKGLADVWVARRKDKLADFGTPSHVPELSSDEPDQVTWVSDDDCELLLDRANHVYVARRPK